MTNQALGDKFLRLVFEGIELKKKIDSTNIEGYRNPLWYDEAKERLSEINGELGEILKPMNIDFEI